MKKKLDITCPARAEYVAPALECNEFETEHGIATSSSTVNMSGSSIKGYDTDNYYGTTSWE